LNGGNPNLKPEKAETWSVGSSIHPHSIPGLSADITYFNINYRNRVAQPVANFVDAFSNSLYAPFLTLSPTPGEVNSAVASTTTGLSNFTDNPFDPSNVIGIVGDEYANVANQHVHGVDLDVDYDLSNIGIPAVADLNWAWLASNQRSEPGAPIQKLAGTLYYAPTNRVRFGIAHEDDEFSASAFVNYIDSETDTDVPLGTRIGSMATVDIAGRYRPQISGFGSGLELSLSVQNLLDAHPPHQVPLSDSDVPYDSNNYSAVGRFVSITVSKKL